VTPVRDMAVTFTDTCNTSMVITGLEGLGCCLGETSEHCLVSAVFTKCQVPDSSSSNSVAETSMWLGTVGCISDCSSRVQCISAQKCQVYGGSSLICSPVAGFVAEHEGSDVAQFLLHSLLHHRLHINTVCRPTTFPSIKLVPTGCKAAALSPAGPSACSANCCWQPAFLLLLHWWMLLFISCVSLTSQPPTACISSRSAVLM